MSRKRLNPRAMFRGLEKRHKLQTHGSGGALQPAQNTAYASQLGGPVHPAAVAAKCGQRSVMLRVVLAPKSIECQFIKRIQNGNDGGMVEQVFTRSMRHGFARMRVLLCEDGRPNMASCADSVRDGIANLFSFWNVAADVEICSFSFMGDTERMTALLMDAEIFYFAGVHGAPPRLNRHLCHLLQERVRCHQMGYFGVCGGATIAGDRSRLALPGLDLFAGIAVQYDSGVSPSAVAVETSAERNVVQFTSGCALAFVLDETLQMGICFACIKNHRRWWPFAAQNSLQVQRIIDTMRQRSLHDSMRFVD